MSIDTGFVDNEHAASSIKSGAMYETAVSARKATWRNGSAFGFDCRRHQKVAGSSPAVVIFLGLNLMTFFNRWSELYTGLLVNGSSLSFKK